MLRRSIPIVLSLCTLSLLMCAVYIVLPLGAVLKQEDLSTVVINQQQQLLAATIASDEQWRFPPPDALPEKYISALLQFEDKRFFSHIGIDPLAIFRAIRLNYQQGKIVSGGSTITMQLARMLRGNQARTYRAKFLEALLALKLEWHLSKREILNYYAAFAPFGGNTVGLRTANWRYFQNPMHNMSWAEAALLAILPNKPASIHPGRNREQLLLKRNRLLTALGEQGHLNTLDLKLAKLETLPDKPKPLPRITPHLLDTLKKQFPRQHQFVTAIDVSLQQHLQALADSYNQQYESDNIHNLSILVLDNEKQAVIAYLGNQTRSQKPAYAAALDIIQRPRSSGSLLKPFLFALMVQGGQILPDSLIEDIPSYYDGYQPQNYDRQFRGLIPAKRALSQSLNVPAVRLLQQYGVIAFTEDLKRIGLSTLWRPAEDYGLSLILGGAETTLWDITNSFSRLMQSAHGRNESLISARLHASQGDDERSVFPVAQGAAWLTLEALLDVNRPGTAAHWRNYASSQKIAWKTGTSYGWHDAWAVGSNGRYTVGVWAGNANGEEARALTGTRTAAPVMLDAFHYLANSEWPSQPIQALKFYEVCERDHYLVANDCKSVKALAPIEADFTMISPYHKLIHVDPALGLRVHGDCENPMGMKTISQFTVPPVHAFYYAQNDAQMPAVPAWRKDCRKNLPAVNQQAPLALEYPSASAKVRIPIELDGQLGRIILKAHHQQSGAVVHWHIDNRFIDSTRHIHEKAIAVNPGWHQITLVDGKGYKVSQWFKAL